MGLKMDDIRGMSKEDLTAKLAELRKELMKLNTQIARGTTLKSPGQVRQLKKTIARMIMVLKTKEEAKTG